MYLTSKPKPSFDDEATLGFFLQAKYLKQSLYASLFEHRGL